MKQKSLLMIVTFLWCGMQAATVSLRMADAYGNAVSSIVAGVPCQLIITVDGSGEAIALPSVPGLDNFERGAVQTSVSHMNMNGVRSVQQQIVLPVRADRPGTYNLGPVDVQTSGATARSNALVVEVTVAPATPNNIPTNGQEQPVVITLALDKQKIVVGEPLLLTITFLRQPDVRLQEPLLLDVEKRGFTLRAKSEPKEFQTLIDGHVYHGTEQIIELYVDEPGSYTIPAIKAHALVPRRSSREHDFFSLADFFGRSGTRSVTYSNSCAVEVLPLPATNHVVLGIGTFTSFSAQMRSHKAKVGQGIELVLELEGSGNAARIEFPLLRLPQGLTAYESKSEMVPHPDRRKPEVAKDCHNISAAAGKDGWKKRFEYIIQGATPGMFTIPEQIFYYFDVKSKNYQTLHSQALPLELVPNELVPNENLPQTPVEAEISQKAEPVQERAASTTHEVKNFDSYSNNWFIFFVGMTCLALLGVGLSVRREYPAYKARNRYKYAFKDARSALKAAEKEYKVTALYGIMTNLFAQRCALPSGMVNEDVMRQKLQEAGMTRDAINAWMHGMAQLAQAAFGKSSASPSDLFALTRYLIDECEKVL